MGMDMGMDMGSTATQGMDMATGTSTMTMASSTSMSGDMSGMDSMSMSMADMLMVFFTSWRTPLFSNSWTPSNQGQYVGTCIFLIALAAILRIMLAIKPLLERHFWSPGSPSHETDADGLLHNNHHQAQEKRIPGHALRMVGRDVGRSWSGWKVGPSASRATFELLIAGVGYLLMIAVMTMNVGYFMSVLAGTWLGTFLLGNLAFDDRWSHC